MPEVFKTGGTAGLGSLAARFLTCCRVERGLADNSISAYSTDLKRFIEFFGESSEFPLEGGLRRYLDHLHRSGLSTRSIARHLTTLRNCYGFLLREGILSSDPTEHLGPVRGTSSAWSQLGTAPFRRWMATWPRRGRRCSRGDRAVICSSPPVAAR
ncbi:MAG: site-specific integrase [Bryobacteraceae bacterium]